MATKLISALLFITIWGCKQPSTKKPAPHKHTIMKTLITTLTLITLIAGHALACTTAIISGKYTSNGRAMIWKLRDTGNLENKMRYFSDGKYNYVGLINSNDSIGEQVWGGSNAAGLAIMNSASFNVNLDDTTSFKDREGYFMKQVLKSCKTLEDVEKLLNERPKPMGLAAHFGVIDATGGAAFYEVNNYSFTRFDANDETLAPNGYIIRTNYSFTGRKDIGYGFIRFQTAQDIFYQADAMNRLTPQTIIQDFSRCLKHAVLGKDFREEYVTVPDGNHFINSGDMITRHESASMILIEGVNNNDPADLSTIWTMAGFPNTCLALPLWVRGGNTLPSVLTAPGDLNCQLNEWALQLKKQCYPIARSAGYKYLNISRLINADGTGIIQKLESFEEDIFRNTNAKLKQWHLNTPSTSEIKGYYAWLNAYTEKVYEKLLK